MKEQPITGAVIKKGSFSNCKFDNCLIYDSYFFEGSNVGNSHISQSLFRQARIWYSQITGSVMSNTPIGTSEEKE